MPDLSTRAQHERELAAAVATLLAAEREQLERNPKSADWPRFTARLRVAIIPHLAGVYLAAAVQLAEQSGRPFNAERLTAEAQQWATRYADALAGAITANTAAGVVAAIQDADDAALAAVLLLLFSSDRAFGIGITETTRAITAGERGVLSRYQLETGELVPVLWKTEADSRVCEICGPLESQPEEVWQRVAGAGPPAHPRCRCWLEYQFAVARRAA